MTEIFGKFPEQSNTAKNSGRYGKGWSDASHVVHPVRIRYERHNGAKKNPELMVQSNQMIL